MSARVGIELFDPALSANVNAKIWFCWLISGNSTV
jgi:hypothetical protein